MKRTNGMVKRAMTRALPVAVCIVLILAACKNPAAPEEEEPKEWALVGQAGFSEGEAQYISLVFDGSGVPYIAFNDSGFGPKAVVMKYVGNEWLPVGTPGFSPGSTYYLSLALDSEGNPSVVFADGVTYKATVMAYEEESPSADWIYLSPLGLSVEQINDPAIAFDPTDTPYVAYLGRAYDTVMVMKYSAYSRSWGPVGVPGEVSSESAWEISLDFDSTGVLYLAFSDNVNSFGKARLMKFDETQSNPVWTEVGSSGGFGSNFQGLLSFQLDPSNIPYAAFVSTGNRVTVMRFIGGSWETVGEACFSSPVGEFLSLSIDAQGVPYVAYDDLESEYRLTVMKFNGSLWETVGATGFSARGIYSVSMAIDPSGTPYVAYQDGENDGKVTVMKYQ